VLLRLIVAPDGTLVHGAAPDAPATAGSDGGGFLPLASPTTCQGLCASMSATKLTLASVDSQPARMWFDQVLGALLMLRADLQEQCDATGGPLGIHRRVLGTAPRLSKAIADLDREHENIARLLDRALADITESASSTRVDRVRAEGFALLRRLTRYQQRDADLLHEADQVDVGGQG
jgi:hypothetical protein